MCPNNALFCLTPRLLEQTIKITPLLPLPEVVVNYMAGVVSEFLEASASEIKLVSTIMDAVILSEILSRKGIITIYCGLSHLNNLIAYLPDFGYRIVDEKCSRRYQESHAETAHSVYGESCLVHSPGIRRRGINVSIDCILRTFVAK